MLQVVCVIVCVPVCVPHGISPVRVVTLKYLWLGSQHFNMIVACHKSFRLPRELCIVHPVLLCFDVLL